jgi:hypothetical protein
MSTPRHKNREQPTTSTVASGYGCLWFSWLFSLSGRLHVFDSSPMCAILTRVSAAQRPGAPKALHAAHPVARQRQAHGSPRQPLRPTPVHGSLPSRTLLKNFLGAGFHLFSLLGTMRLL